jgi:hypothetical protein
LELAVTLWAFGTYLLIISNRRRPTGLSKGLMVAGSLVLYSSWLVKQSFIFSIFCSVLAVFCFRDGYFRQRLKLILGSLIVFLLVVTVWAAKVGGSSGFWHTMFDGSSKGVTIAEIPVRIIQWGVLLPMTNHTAMSLLLVGCIILGVQIWQNSIDTEKEKSSVAIGPQITYTSLVGFFFVSLFSEISFKYFVPALVFATGFVLKNLLQNAFDPIHRTEDKRIFENENSFSHWMLLVASFWITTYAFYSNSDWSLGLLPAGIFITNAMTSASVFFLVVCLLENLGSLSFKVNLGFWRSVPSVDLFFQKKPQLLSVILVCVAIPVTNSLSGNTKFESWMFAFILMASVFVYVGGKFSSRFGHEVLLTLSVLLVVPSGLWLPYSWWGLNVGPISMESEVSDPIVRALKINEADAVLLQELDRVVIDEGKILLADGRKPITFMGPQIAGLQFRYDVDSLATTCAIVWFDVCSAESAAKTFEEVKEGKPDLIVWLVAPEAVMHGHEEAFLEGGQSEIRKFQIWLTNESCKAGYKKVTIGSSPWYQGNMHFDVYINRRTSTSCT